MTDFEINRVEINNTILVLRLTYLHESYFVFSECTKYYLS